MAIDYNANLIAELYATKNAEKATQISNEMVKIGDAIFPRQIFEAYKKFQKTAVSHYFVSDLTSFKNGDAAEILKEIAHTTNRDADISMAVGYFTDIQYFNPKIIDKVKKLFEGEITAGEIYEYDLEKYFTYLEKSGEKTEWLEPLLQACFEDDKENMETRKAALKKLLKLKPKEYVDLYYENYDSIKGKRSEIIFVEEISTWHGGLIPTLHEKILEVGSERAKEILNTERTRKDKEKQSKEMKEQKEVREEYQTADVISDIAELRSRINKISTTDERFRFSFLSPLEEIYQQGKPAKDKATLVGYCMVLRSLLGTFDKKITEIEISKEEAKKFIPDINDLRGSINKFHFLLLKNGVNVDPGICGLRNINRIVSKLAHPDEKAESELLDALKKEKLFDYYKNDNWSVLHREILLRYKGVLEKLIDAIRGK